MCLATLAKIVSPPMQCEFRTGLSRAQCSIAYNGNMGVCNQCQRYRWRLTVPELLHSSRTSFYRTRISGNLCSTNTWKRKRGIRETRLRRRIKDLHKMYDDVWHDTSLVSRNIAPEKPEEKFVRKQRFIDLGYKICLSLHHSIESYLRFVISIKFLHNRILLYLTRQS